MGVNAGTITNAYATGAVDLTSDGPSSYAGGLVGVNAGTITHAYATGNVSSTNVFDDAGAGGLVGANNSGTIIHTYATGNASAASTFQDAYAGGLVGQNIGTITHAYATGNASAASTNQDAYAGGLLGENRGAGSSTASYWNTETSGLTVSVGKGTPPSGVTGLTTEQMKNAASFADWGIDAQGGTGTVWRIYEGHTAPLLRHFLTALEVTGDSTTTYNGTEQSGTWSATGEYDTDRIFGQVSGGGRNADTYNIDMSGLYSDQQGYDLITTNGTLTINKAQATVTANSGTTTYNGTEQSVDGFTVDGLVNGEDQSVLTGVTTSGGKGTNAGSYVLTVGGGTADNYELSFVDGKLTINKAQATVTANSGTTTYNGTEQSISGFTVEGLVNGEDASVLNGITTSGGKGTNAGSYVLTVGGGTADNYELSFVDGKLTINKAQATVTANSGTTTYNGTEQSISGFTVEGLVNGEDQSVLTDVTVNGGGRNAGSYTLTANGSDGNYELTFVDGTLTINKAQATVTANSGTTTYNGTEQSVDGFTVDGLVNGEDQSVLTGVTTSGGTGTNAGTYVLTASGSGSDGNYALTFIDGALTIERKAIAADILAQDKPFDGTLTAVLEGVLNGAISGDDVELQLSGLFANLTPGENRVLVDASLTGADAGNYQLIIPDSVPANMQGFVQSAGYQSAMDSRPRSQVELDAPSDTDYQLDIDDDALSLPMVSR